MSNAQAKIQEAVKETSEWLNRDGKNAIDVATKNTVIIINRLEKERTVDIQRLREPFTL